MPAPWSTYQYMGREDFTADNEADYVMDDNDDGNSSNDSDDDDDDDDDDEEEAAAAPWTILLYPIQIPSC